MNTTTRSERLRIRLTPSEKQLVKQAAKTRGMSLSEFGRNAAVQAAALDVAREQQPQEEQ